MGKSKNNQPLSLSKVLEETGLTITPKEDASNNDYNRKMLDILDRDLDCYSQQTDRLQKQVKWVKKQIKKQLKGKRRK